VFRLLLSILLLAAVLGGAYAALVVFWAVPSVPNHAVTSSEALLAKGRYLARLGNCEGCHTAEGGRAFAGGRRIDGPLASVTSANLTPDRATGIGHLSSAEFYSVLAYGAAGYFDPVYPAMPYSFYHLVSRADSDAIFAYLMSQTAVAAALDDSVETRFPRPLLYLWNAMAAGRGPFESRSDRSEVWNRGAYLVEGLMHCGLCHTARNAIGGLVEARALEGKQVGLRWIPDISPGALSLRGWTAVELQRYLVGGVKPDGSATEEPLRTQKAYLSRLNEADRAAVITYLLDLPSEGLRR